MIKIEYMHSYGWSSAIRGMRNPMDSWDKIDSDFTTPSHPKLGEKDYDLVKRLCQAGSVHAKFRRFIVVYMDITAPRYFWTDFDTYRIGRKDNIDPDDIEYNSCSTMYTIHKRELTLNDFSTERLDETDLTYFKELLKIINIERELYLQTKDPKYKYRIHQMLPQSFNQKRTVMLNYEVLANIYANRKSHFLNEFKEFCQIIEYELPYPEIFTGKF